MKQKQIIEENKNFFNEKKKRRIFISRTIFKSKILFDGQKKNLLQNYFFSVLKMVQNEKNFIDYVIKTIIFIETTKSFKFGGYT